MSPSPALCSTCRHHRDAAKAWCRPSRLWDGHAPRIASRNFSLVNPLSSDPNHRPQCPPAWCAPLPLEPAALVCAAARARPSVSTKTAARLAKTAQKACMSAICPRRAWPITTAKAQRAILLLIALLATLCRPPGPVPLTPGSPLWAQAEPDTFRPPPKSECFVSLRAPSFAFCRRPTQKKKEPKEELFLPLLLFFIPSPCIDVVAALASVETVSIPSRPLALALGPRYSLCPPDYFPPEWPGRPSSLVLTLSYAACFVSPLAHFRSDGRTARFFLYRRPMRELSNSQFPLQV